MVTVRVNAKNLKIGDVLSGERVKVIIPHMGRQGPKVTVLTPHKDGYKFRQHQFGATEKIVVKRPKYNIGH